MKNKSLFTSKSGVSPVIGVILIVGLTVLIASAVTTFVIAMGDSNQVTNNEATFNYDLKDNVDYDTDYNSYIADKLTITHIRGDSINSSKLEVRTVGDGVKYIKDDGNLGPRDYDSKWTFKQIGESDEVNPGDSIKIVTVQQDADANYRDVVSLDEQKVSIVYNSSSSAKTTTLGSWTGPER